MQFWNITNMQLQAIIDLKHLTAAETAAFEEKCRASGVTPELKLAQLIKADSTKRVSAATDSAGRRSTPRKTRRVA